MYIWRKVNAMPAFPAPEPYVKDTAYITVFIVPTTSSLHFELGLVVWGLYITPCVIKSCFISHRQFCTCWSSVTYGKGEHARQNTTYACHNLDCTKHDPNLLGESSVKHIPLGDYPKIAFYSFGKIAVLKLWNVWHNSQINSLPSGIMCMRPANERRRYNVTSSLIGYAHTQNNPWPW